MGCPCELRLFPPNDTKDADAGKLLEGLVAEAHRFEHKYSRYLPSSVVSKINAAAGNEPVDIDSETSAILQYAKVCHEQSDGLFDITAGSLRTIWHPDIQSIPDQAAIDEQLTRVGFDLIRLSAESVFLTVQGMEIDFGGVVKEYAADAIVSMAKSSGVKHGLVNLGGDISVIGPQPDGRPWPIGITDPFGKGEAIATIALTEGALTTSGSYERYFQIGGKRYSHLINPLTGWPVEGLVSASVVADLAVVAGSVTSVALLNGASQGIEWLQQCQLPYLAIDQQKKTYGSLA